MCVCVGFIIDGLVSRLFRNNATNEDIKRKLETMNILSCLNHQYCHIEFKYEATKLEICRCEF
jgi:hypothetical protein